MAEAARDQNHVTTLLAASSVDGVTPVRVYANPTTHRLLVEATTGVSGPGSSTDEAVAVFDGTTGETIKETLIFITAAGIIQILGKTAAFPALKRSGTIIQIRLADDSNYGTLDALAYKAGGTAPVADGTYVVGSKITPVTGDDGTITIKGGIIIAVQPAT